MLTMLCVLFQAVFDQLYEAMGVTSAMHGEDSNQVER